MRARFADIVLDIEGMELRRSGEPVPVEPQVLEVLAYLVRHRDRMVPKTELLDEIWGDRFVSESALSSRIKSARQAIGDNGREQRLIRTVHGRGFRFVGELAEDSPAGAGGDGRSDGPLDAGDLPAGLIGRVARGSGPAVELVGASGSIRAETIDAVQSAAERAGLLVGRGGGGGELRPFAGVLDAVDEWVHRRPEVLTDVPQVCASELAAVLGGAPPTSRQRLHLAVREVLGAASRSGGAILVVEDVHLIDRSTLDVVAHAARVAQHLHVAVVVTHRPGFDLGRGFTTVQLPGSHHDVADQPPPEVLAALARVAVLGDSCTSAELEAASRLDGAAAGRVVELGVEAGLLERTGPGARFVDAGEAERLAAQVPAPERAVVHRAVAGRLLADGAPPGAVADHLEAASAPDEAAPFQVEAARAAARAQLHAEVLDRTRHVDQVADPAMRLALLDLRADALAAQADPEAVRRFRDALRLAPPDQVPWLRARLARAHLFAGDVDAASEVLEGVTPPGGPHDGGIMLVLGMAAYLRDDLELAERLADEARVMALAPGAPPQMLDVIALQGMIAHSRGEWFDRLRRELRATADSAELASTVFDSHLCVAQYLLYGPTGHAEVVRLADDLRASAEASGSRRAAGFADTLAGEAKLLAGDLAGARASFEASVALHREIRADTGLAHALQRLAEVELAEGERARAERLCREALPLARWSLLSQHLLQRTYGTLIAAAPDAEAAAALVDEAHGTLDGPAACELCGVTVAVPAAIALAGVGRLDEAWAQIELAERCAAKWDGPAWPAAVHEAEAVLARAEGRDDDARRLLDQAAAGFDASNQPLDAARCREAR